MNEHASKTGQQRRDADLQDMVSAAFSDDGLRSASDCPSPEWWYEWAAGHLDSHTDATPAVQSPRSQPDAIEHAATCARCSAERTLAEAFVEEQVATGREPATNARTLAFPSVATLKRPSNTMRLAGLLAAAAILFAVVGTVSVMRQPTVRPPGSGELVRSQTVAAIAPIGNLSAAPTEFEWTEVDNAAAYELIIERVDGERVLTRASATSTVELQPDDVSALQDFVRYRWTVVATLNNGGTARSLTTGFRIEPEPTSTQ